MPSFFYVLMRIIVSLGAVVVLLQEIKRDVTLLGIAFLGILFIFNPILPIHLYKKILWMPLNSVAAFLFLIYGYKNQLTNS